MKAAAGAAFIDSGASVEVQYRAGRPARIDGVVGGQVAVEVESREAKQVRGAVLDLLFHPLEKKLLVLVPVHMTDADITADQCRCALGKYLRPSEFRVVVLRGTGGAPQPHSDARIIRQALVELGWRASYYIYENWQAGPHTAVIHTAMCGFCRDGRGRAGGYDRAHAQWHPQTGPPGFPTSASARAYARRKLRTARLTLDRCVKRVALRKCNNGGVGKRHRKPFGR